MPLSEIVAGLRWLPLSGLVFRGSGQQRLRPKATARPGPEMMSPKCPQGVRGADTFAPAAPHSHATNGGLRASTPLPLRVIGVEALDLISAGEGAARELMGCGGEGMGGGLRGDREAEEGRRFALILAARAGCRPLLTRAGKERSPGSIGQYLYVLEQEVAWPPGVQPCLGGDVPPCRMLVGVCGQPTLGRARRP